MDEQNPPDAPAPRQESVHDAWVRLGRERAEREALRAEAREKRRLAVITRQDLEQQAINQLIERGNAQLAETERRRSSTPRPEDPADVIARIKRDYLSLSEKDKATVFDWFVLGCKEDQS
jgi:hypothetical protein